MMDSNIILHNQLYMSVIHSHQQAEANIIAIQNELQIIDQQHKQREKIYQECLKKYLNHLNTQTQQLLNSSAETQKRDNNILQAFETTYDSIFDGADKALRSIKRTYQAKKKFWEETIEDYVSVPDLEIKKLLYANKYDAEEKIEDAIQVRKNMKKFPFKRVFVKKEIDRTLANFQSQNHVFEEKVNLGTYTLNKWRLQNTYFNSENKENEKTLRSNNLTGRKGESNDSILNQFVKR